MMIKAISRFTIVEYLNKICIILFLEAGGVGGETKEYYTLA